MMNIHGFYGILHHMRTILTKFGFGKKGVIITVVAIVVVAGAIYFFWLKSNSSPYQLVSVSRGTITEVVSVTGNTTRSKVSTFLLRTAVPWRQCIRMREIK